MDLNFRLQYDKYEKLVSKIKILSNKQTIMSHNINFMKVMDKRIPATKLTKILLWTIV